jgi:hypothetical protein
MTLTFTQNNETGTIALSTNAVRCRAARAHDHAPHVTARGRSTPLRLTTPLRNIANADIVVTMAGDRAPLAQQMRSIVLGGAARLSRAPRSSLLAPQVREG